ncbi:MAG TPA: EAL domain-containing protein [Aquifex aeolicus]|nr:EAL domain-containing protein [Aquifex aeolicus]
MVKVEGIYKGFCRVGQELLLDERGFSLIAGNKEKFFSGLDEDIDFSVFLRHVKWIEENEPEGYTFINLKPATFIRYYREIGEVVKGKVVVELREDHITERELEKIVYIREEFPFLLSLDDFGRSSSNLDRLIALKPNFVKIDMSLFSDSGSLLTFTNFLRSYSGQAVLVAEKVETERELRMARGAGIELWQGYLERDLTFTT